MNGDEPFQIRLVERHFNNVWNFERAFQEIYSVVIFDDCVKLNFDRQVYYDIRYYWYSKYVRKRPPFKVGLYQKGILCGILNKDLIQIEDLLEFVEKYPPYFN